MNPSKPGTIRGLSLALHNLSMLVNKGRVIKKKKNPGYRPARGEGEKGGVRGGLGED